MFVLGTEDLKEAENILKGLFPESLKVYGCLFNINRGKPLNLEVIADSWPDFRVIICRPKLEGSLDREGDFNIHSIYSKDRHSLQRLLGACGAQSWTQFTLLAGVDIRHLDAVKELAVRNNTPTKLEGAMFVFVLEDLSDLKDTQSQSAERIAPLTAAHAELVNSTWKYGGDQNSHASVQSYISSYPSACVLGEDGRPVSWALLVPYGAIGLLYTLPEHRRKGYARQVVAALARCLLEQGRPAYCTVEEGNRASYSLFTSLGFRHGPEYRAIWFQLNPR